MAYNVYKSTNKGHNWTLQGTTTDIPPAFIIGGEETSYAYNSVPWPTRPAAVDNPQDGYVVATPFNTSAEYDNTAVFAINIAAPEQVGGITATATPVMVPSPANPSTKVIYSTSTITEAGSGYIAQPTATLFVDGVSSDTVGATLIARSKYITYSLTGTEWDYNIVTPLGTDLEKIITFQSIYSGYYFTSGIDLNAITTGVYTGTDPTNLISTLDTTSASFVSIPVSLSTGIYVVVDNSLYKFATTTWNLVGTLTNTTTATNLYPTYIIKTIVETNNGFFAKVTDNPATTAYIFKSTDLLNWSNEQTLGSSDTYDEVTQYLYSFDDNTASFTSTNYLAEIS